MRNVFVYVREGLFGIEANQNTVKTQKGEADVLIPAAETAFASWKAGQPDNWENSTEEFEDYYHIIFDSQAKTCYWNDTDPFCYSYITEQPIQ